MTAEWVVERPKVNGTISTLADFGNATFIDCKATLDGVTATIGNFSYAQLVMHEEETPLVSVSPLNAYESGFTVSYLEPPSATTLANDLPIRALTTESVNAAFSAKAKTSVYKKLSGTFW